MVHECYLKVHGSRAEVRQKLVAAGAMVTPSKSAQGGENSDVFSFHCSWRDGGDQAVRAVIQDLSSENLVEVSS